jgi:hypothetical protein
MISPALKSLSYCNYKLLLVPEKTRIDPGLPQENIGEGDRPLPISEFFENFDQKIGYGVQDQKVPGKN